MTKEKLLKEMRYGSASDRSRILCIAVAALIERVEELEAREIPPVEAEIDPPVEAEIDPPVEAEIDPSVEAEIDPSVAVVAVE